MFHGGLLRGSALCTGLLCLALLAGCPSLGPQSAAPPSLDRATVLARQGDPAGAARVYEALANENSGIDRDSLLLRASSAYLDARLPDDAARVFANVPQPAGPPAIASYLEVKRRLASSGGRMLDAVRAEIDQERWLATAPQRHATRLAMLTELRAASERGIKVDPRTAPDATARGWLELADLSAAAARAPAFAATTIDQWRARYPNHPADEVVASELLGMHPAELSPLPHIALLLPLKGRQAAAAASVRDGFLTAYYVNPPSARPRVRIYDTSAMSVAEAVQHATQAGAQFIVGPLTREEVIAAADLPPPHPPVLALNFLTPEHVVPPGFYQFALSPEDEARETARRILADGHRRGVALVPEGDWGQRVLAAFRDELTAGGGDLVDAASFDATHTDFAPAITRVLRIADSDARRRHLESILGTKLQFQPRRRGDIAFIFAASSASTARLLRPQLKFYFAGDIATYATSDAFEPNANANQDMDGLIFPDMPWMLGGGLADSVRTAAHEAWPTGGPRRNRIFAFGFDAYRLATALQAAPGGGTISVDGLTGHLTLDAQHRVRRELEWAQLHGGEPRLIARE